MATDKSLRSKQRAFLAAMAETGNITGAAAAAKITRQAHYNWLADDPDGSYAAAFKVAEEDAADALEQEARRRAIKGSDLLMIFMLKGAKPEKYKDRGQFEHTGKGGGPIQVERLDLTKLSDEELDALDRIVDKGTPDLATGDRG